MILYLDTSSLVKLYVEEEGSGEIRALVDEADIVSTSVLAYPESYSAFARQQREGGLTIEEYWRAKADLARDWPTFLRIDVTEPIYRHAGELAGLHALRGFDSLHLASYLALVSVKPHRTLRFSSFDERLNKAASREGGG
ncbi:MAG TPA: type II toxin-antitoxin system VapC family toxin [Thermoanaerobaculia bacterium]|nr:type II toxin-antitoxin system VapC family toxin [Thermoanaerobaculia bacterium]